MIIESLQGKTAIVTGGGSGIGKAVARRFAQLGAHVVVADVSERAGSEAVKEISKSNPDLHHIFVQCNVADKANVDHMFDEAIKAFGNVDILVNNAGILIPRLLVDPQGVEEITEEVFDKMINVNLKSSFLCAQAVTRDWLKKERSGVIINMTSESGLEGSEGQSVYAATKAAQYSITRSWAKELGRYGIRVVGVAPGILEVTALRTEAYERALAHTRRTTVEELRKNYSTKAIPLGREGKLDEVANLVCFAASDEASYITGTTLNISGGKSRG